MKFLGFVFLLFLAFTFANECLQTCQSDTNSIICCSNQGQNIILPVLQDRCFFYCNVTCIHNGPCQCPSNCYNHLGQGNCLNGKCQCNNGWTGKDCSMIKCPNECSRNGKCLQFNGMDYCKCDEGYTGTDCSTESFKLTSVLPYGEIFTERRHFFDIYGDKHPILNVSSHSFFYFTCEQKDIEKIYDARTMWDNEYAKCDMIYNNNHIQEFHKDVGFRIKGTATRMQLKKNFRISFNKFNSTRRFYGIRQLGFKSADPGLIRSFITFEMYRALGIPTQRSSFATIFINGIQFGVYWMSEEITKEFLTSRFQDPSGTLYKCGLAASDLRYHGDDTNIYRMMNKTMFNGRYFGYIYQQEYGKGDFKDFVELLRVLDSKITPDSLYPILINRIFNVDMYLRLSVIEILTSFADGYTLMNNNVYLYNEKLNQKFEFWPYDYDSTYEYDRFITGEYDDWAKIDIYRWGNFSKRQGRSIPYAPLALRTLNVKEFKERLTRYFHVILSRIFNPYQGPLIPRINELKRYLSSFVNSDYHFIMHDPVRSVNTFRATIHKIKQYIKRRYDNAMKQLQNN